jgi:hypothetical protein
MDLSRLKQINEVKADKALSETRHGDLLKASAQTSDTVLSATTSLIKYLEGHTTKTQVVNQLKTIGTPDALKVVKALNELHATLKTHKNTDLTELTKLMHGILDEAKKIPKELPKEKEEKFIDYTKQLNSLGDAVKAVEKVIKAQKLVAEAPIINLPETVVKVDAPDLKPLQKDIKDVAKAVNAIAMPDPTDTTGIEKLIKASNGLLTKILEKPVGGGGGGGGRATPYQGTDTIPLFPNAVVSSATPTITAVAVVNPDGSNIAGGGGGAGDLHTQAKGATAAGYPTSTTASADRQLLDVTLRDTSGAAVAVGGGTQYADGAARGTATGTMMIGDDGTNVQSVKVDTSGVMAIQDNGGSITVDGAFFQATQPVSAVSLPLPTGAATSALQTQPGVDIGDVTINNASGASAVNIQDGGNSITVDGTVAVSGSVAVTGPLTDTQLRATAVPVSLTSTTITGSVAVTGPLTDTQLRASVVPVSLTSTTITGTVTVGSHAVTNAGTFATQVTASTTGGYTPGKLVSAATTNATSIKASAGTLGFLTASNVNASPRYVKLYNKASAPTVGTDVPVFTFIIPGNTSGAGTNIPIPPQGLNFSTGIALALTTEATDVGSTGVALSEIVVNWGTI